MRLPGSGVTREEDEIARDLVRADLAAKGISAMTACNLSGVATGPTRRGGGLAERSKKSKRTGDSDGKEALPQLHPIIDDFGCTRRLGGFSRKKQKYKNNRRS